MPVYTPLPESIILTDQQVKDFEQLQESLSQMRGWLESRNYQSTTVEPVIVARKSWLLKREVMATELQRIYPLNVAFILTGHKHYSDKMYAVNVDGDLLVGRLARKFIHRSHYKVQRSNHPSSNADWASAQFTGLNPAAIYSIVTAINEATAR